jgi:hypothetical protein
VVRGKTGASHQSLPTKSQARRSCPLLDPHPTPHPEPALSRTALNPPPLDGEGLGVGRGYILLRKDVTVSGTPTLAPPRKGEG